VRHRIWKISISSSGLWHYQQYQTEMIAPAPKLQQLLSALQGCAAVYKEG
jgi:hypothetical protein